MKRQIHKAIEVVKKKKHISSKERERAYLYTTHMLKQHEGTLKLGFERQPDKK